MTYTNFSIIFQKRTKKKIMRKKNGSTARFLIFDIAVHTLTDIQREKRKKKAGRHFAVIVKCRELSQLMEISFHQVKGNTELANSDTTTVYLASLFYPLIIVFNTNEALPTTFE